MADRGIQIHKELLLRLCTLQIHRWNLSKKSHECKKT